MQFLEIQIPRKLFFKWQKAVFSWENVAKYYIDTLKSRYFL